MASRPVTKTNWQFGWPEASLNMGGFDENQKKLAKSEGLRVAV